MSKLVRTLIIGGITVTGGALLLGLGAAGVAGAAPAVPANAVTTVVKAAATKQVAYSVQLTAGTGTGTKRTYEAMVLDKAGKRITGATLDLGGLEANPDVRVVTTKMVPETQDPSIYTVTVDFPSDGDYALVVRVHQPTQMVQLFSEKVAGIGAPLSAHDVSANPSLRTLLKEDPTFFQKYNGGSELGTVSASAENAAATGGHGASTAGTGSIISGTGHGGHPFDATSVLFVMAHTFGALAWMVSVLGLVLANRLGSGAARNELTRFIGRHYTVLAGGGLLVLSFSGLETALRASAGLAHPSQLLDTRTGTAYLAVFGLKMSLVVGSLVTSWRLGKVLPTPARLLGAPRLASLGAMANEEPNPVIYRLAEANASFGALIIGCVVVLGQLHHAL